LAPAIPTREPGTLTAGDTAKWTRSLPEFSPADGWVLSYSFRGPSKLDVQAAAQTADWLVTLLATDTAKLEAGRYEWIARVALAGEVYTVADGTLLVEPNLALANAGDRLSHDERMLAALEALAEGKVTADAESYSIGDRSIVKLPMEQVLRFIGIYRAKVWRARHPGQSLPNHVVTFRAVG
jgi:hypothetical protein